MGNNEQRIAVVKPREFVSPTLIWNFVYLDQYCTFLVCLRYECKGEYPLEVALLDLLKGAPHSGYHNSCE